MNRLVATGVLWIVIGLNLQSSSVKPIGYRMYTLIMFDNKYFFSSGFGSIHVPITGEVVDAKRESL
jgi:hypothetical protein